MTNRRLRLLNLGNALPPGRAGQFFINSGEIQLWQNLSRFAEVATVGLLPGKLWKKRLAPKDDSPGLEHELLLWDRNPALWHRWISWRKLRRFYLGKARRGESPDVLVVRNLQPVFHHFVRWLRRQPRRPLIVLVLNDSGGLGEEIPWSKRWRYKFKPMQVLEEESALTLYDASIISSITAKRYFEPRGVPWVWHPAAYKFEYDPPAPSPDRNGPIRFGYFGSLSKSYALLPLVRAFLKAGVPGSLHVCGGGALSGELAELARLHRNFHFDGFLPKESDCLDWAQQVDVLINSRLPVQGQDNSFPSKVFEYGMAGKAILSTRVGGVDDVLGAEGIYFDTDKLEETLPQKFREVSAMDRAELQRRGRIIHNRIAGEFSAGKQARRIFEFLAGLVKSPPFNP